MDAKQINQIEDADFGGGVVLLHNLVNSRSAKIYERYGSVGIDIPFEGPCLEGTGEVATGISGGADSMYTVAHYSKASGPTADA